MSKGIVVIGATFVDIKGYPEGKYVPAGRNAGTICEVHGGVSRNVAEDIANVELRPTFISVVDHSGISTDVINKLNRHKVDTSYIRRTEDGLGTWLAVFSHNGDVVASISKRPDLSEISTILKEQGDEIIADADAVTVDIDMESYILKQILDLAEKYHKQVYAVVSNMSIAMERRDLMKRTACLVCNAQEAGLLFSDDYEKLSPEELAPIIGHKVKSAQYPRMVVTMGEQGAVYAEIDGSYGICPPINVAVVDTTGAGDAFFSGVTIGLTYDKTLGEACHIGARLASSVISTTDNVCPRFMPEEFDLKVNRS